MIEGKRGEKKTTTYTCLSASSKDDSASRQPDTVIFLQAIYNSAEGILLLRGNYKWT